MFLVAFVFFVKSIFQNCLISISLRKNTSRQSFFLVFFRRGSYSMSLKIPGIQVIGGTVAGLLFATELKSRWPQASVLILHAALLAAVSHLFVVECLAIYGKSDSC